MISTMLRISTQYKLGDLRESTRKENRLQWKIMRHVNFNTVKDIEESFDLQKLSNSLRI